MAVGSHSIRLDLSNLDPRPIDDLKPANCSASLHLASNPCDGEASPVPSSTASPTAPTTPPVRSGTIIKGYRRIASTSSLRTTPTYKVRKHPGPSAGQWVFIVNGTKLKEWNMVGERLLSQLRSVEVQVKVTKYPGHGRRIAERAARNGADLIAAVGGDGTLNEVVDGVMRAGVVGPDGLPNATVTVLPVGSASDFHRSMAWDPQDFESAMWRIGHRGETAILDVAKIRCASPLGPRERYFINVASCGVSACAALKLSKWKWMGEKLKYRMAGLMALCGHVPRALAVRIDDGRWEKVPRASLVAIGNGSYFGHGLNIAPNANPYDGKVQVVMGSRVSALDFIFNSWKLKMGKHLEMKNFANYDASSQVDVALWDSKRAGPSLAGNLQHILEPARPPPPSCPSSSETSFTFSAGTTTATEVSPSPSLGSLQSGPPDSCASDIGSSSGTREESLRRRSPPASSVGLATAHNSRKKVKGEKIDYGPMPVEVDGEVIGHAPFSVQVMPHAIRFRVPNHDVVD